MSSDLRDYNTRNILHFNYKAFELRGYRLPNINEFCYIIIITRTENGRKSNIFVANFQAIYFFTHNFS